MRLALMNSLAISALVLAASPTICFASDGADPDAGGGSPPAAAPEAPTAATEAAEPTSPKPAKPAKSPKPRKGAPAVDGSEAHVVWAMPGHATFGIGMMVRTDPENADSLRASGQARLATDAEVAEAIKHGRPIHDLG